MKAKAEITKEEFLQRMERSVQHAQRQPGWMIGRPENRRVRENALQGEENSMTHDQTVKVASAFEEIDRKIDNIVPVVRQMRDALVAALVSIEMHKRQGCIGCEIALAKIEAALAKADGK